MRRASATLLIAVLVGVFTPSTASASMIAATASCVMVPTALWSCDDPTAVVGGGTEFNLLLQTNRYFSVNLDAFAVQLTQISGGGLDMNAGETLTLSNLLPLNETIIGVSVVAGAGVSGFTTPDVAFGPQSLVILLHGSDWSTDSGAQITIQTAQVPVPVPEPATLSLLSLGMVGAYARRRRRQS